MNIFLQDFSSNWYNLFHVFFPVASSTIIYCTCLWFPFCFEGIFVSDEV